MALLTRAEMDLLAQFNAVNGALNVAQRLRDAETLQCAGDTATSHIRLVTLPLAGDTVRVEAHGGVNRLGIWDVGCVVTLEFTTTGAVTTPGNMPVLIGPDLGQTAQALALAITRSTIQAVVAEAHAIDLGVTDICHNTAGASLTVSTVSGGRCVTQDNNEQLPLDSYVMIIRRRTISSEDVARGRIRFDTGWSSIVEGFASLYRSGTDQSPQPFNGQITMNAGILELQQGTGAGVFSTNNIMQLTLLGVR
jgi:hypothetical protein